MVRRSPGFTAVAAVSLALGIGANTAIFTLINTLMLRTLPVREPHQLVELVRTFESEPPLNSYSWQSYEYFRDHSRTLSALVAAGGAEVPVRIGTGEAERVNVAAVSGDFFGVLGIQPAIGRLIGPSDDAIAVVSWDYWQAHFSGRTMGAPIVVEDTPFAIAGVLPRGFSGLQPGFRTDIWIPATTPAARKRGMSLVGRLRPGATLEQARAEFAALYRQSIDAGINSGPFLSRMKIGVEPAAAGLSRLRYRYARPLMLVMSLVGLMLLIACTNVGSMLLARGAARQREIAVRVSLGAGRARLVRQMLTESLVLAGAAGLLGLLVARAGTRALMALMTSGRERFDLDTPLDSTVLLFTAVVAILTGVLFGLAPAWQAFAAAPVAALRGGRSSDTRFARWLGKGLVAVQVALSLVLLTGASLLLRHLAAGYAALGFDRDRVLVVTLDPSGRGLRTQQLIAPYRELLQRLSAIPGVRSATFGGATPLSGAGASRAATVEGYQAKPGELRYVMENWVAPGYFETLGTPLVAGRDFSVRDEGGPGIAIVNRAMARYYFGDASAIGKHVLFDGDREPYEIVGVVGDAKYLEMREATPRTIYFNAFREGRVFSNFLLRTRLEPGAIAAEVRRTSQAVLPNVPVRRITTLAEQVDASIVPERMIVTLSGLFGGLGALLAAIGLYGLLAYTVARRVSEIGVRMALGATRLDVTRMVLGDALRMVAAGLVLGVPAAFWGRRLAASLVEGLTAGIAAPVAIGAAALLAVALIAAFVPARRAARVEPMEALRQD